MQRLSLYKAKGNYRDKTTHIHSVKLSRKVERIIYIRIVANPYLFGVILTKKLIRCQSCALWSFVRDWKSGFNYDSFSIGASGRVRVETASSPGRPLKKRSRIPVELQPARLSAEKGT